MLLLFAWSASSQPKDVSGFGKSSAPQAIADDVEVALHHQLEERFGRDQPKVEPDADLAQLLLVTVIQAREPLSL